MTVDEAIEKAEWVRIKNDPGSVNAEFYQGATKGGWVLNAAVFDIEDQGFPKGTRGYDGAVALPDGIWCV